ncbi:DNA topoisomerase 1 [Saitozyma podzolica]|uniref:DNA topoisomerase I n=1 Tax=Saitozyma podzolica TaxID=1890683 RepID=A0A427YL44_9TREE|nr:DNA topoisomerase 1 [Saitozyma podzolica]
MSAPEPMAVVAPNLGSSASTLASRAPEVVSRAPRGRPDDSDDDEEMPLARKANGAKPNGGGGGGTAKRVVESSSEDEKPLSKKPRVSTTKRRIVDSEDEESEAGPSSSPAVPVKKEAPPTPQANGKPRSNKVVKPASDSDLSEDDKPLASKASKPASKPRSSTNANGNGNGNGVAKPKAKPKKPVSESDDLSDEESSYSDESDDKPLAKKAKPAPAPKAAPAKPRKSDSATPTAKPKPSAKAVKKLKSEPTSSEDEDEVPLAKKAAPTTKGKAKDVKKEVVKVKKEKKGQEEDEEEEKYKWWENEAMGDGSVKWTTLEHQAVLFPPPYIPLPKGIKMKYDGVPLTLPPESEEVAGFFGAMLETDHAQDAKFRENFFKDFKEILASFPPASFPLPISKQPAGWEDVKVKSLDKCDFRPMFDHFEREREKKKAMTKDEKKAVKEAKDKLEAPYLLALVDGRKEKVGNFRAEPPGLFRGRGEHPKKGTLKKRLRPEDILLNIGKDAQVPKANIPGEWKGVQHDSTVTWLAHWKENVNGNSKYVFLSAGSSWKGQSDRQKFEKARELIKHIDRIRKDYTEDLKSKVMADRQRATALYFIDKLALRAGNEKGEDEADTVGCCSLRYEHVTLEPPNRVIFDFLGKDSMRFHQEVEVDKQVFKNIKIFKDNKTRGDDIFDRLNTTLLNNHLRAQMPGLSAKVFRTYNASWTFQQQLKNTPKKGTVQEKIAAYNTANREVAILCNHQKTVSKTFADSFAKMGDKVSPSAQVPADETPIPALHARAEGEETARRVGGDESDMDEEFMERHEADLLEKATEAAKKKWEKENLKLAEEKEDTKPKSVLDERLKEIKAEFKELARERKTKKVEPRKGATEEKLLEQISKMDDRIAAARVQMEDRDKTKDVALGTSKINYIDPRLTVAWARKYEVPLEKLFSKTLREKFPWAEAEADADWVF